MSESLQPFLVSQRGFDYVLTLTRPKISLLTRRLPTNVVMLTSDGIALRRSRNLSFRLVLEDGR